MRFLIVTRPAHPFPPEAGQMLLAGMRGWLSTHRGSGKMEHVWAFAGTNGGGGVLNVDSHEELDAIMSGFPFGPFSTIEVYPLADLDAGLNNFEAILNQMMGGQGG